MLYIDPFKLTFWQWWVAYSAYWKSEEIKQRAAWEQTRMIAYYSAMPHVKKIRKFTDIVEFSWEKKQKSKPLTKEEFYKLKDKYYGR